MHGLRNSPKVFLGPCSLFLVLCLLLSGCSGLLNQEHRVIAPHLEQRGQAGDQTHLQVYNLSDLKDVLKELIRQRGESVRIRYANYSGDIKVDISRAFFDIRREDPVGAYLLDYFRPDYTPLGTEVTVSIGYLSGRDQDIPVVSMSGLTDAFEEALADFQSKLVREVSYLDSSADLNTLLREAYYRDPARAVGLPTLSFTPYPDSGFRRILDMDIKYPFSAEETEQRISKANQGLEALLRQLPDGLEPPFRALALYDILCREVSAGNAPSDPERSWSDAGDNSYSALAEGRAVSAGFALVYKLLCDRSGLECQLVTGLRGNTQYVWNLISLDNEWYHVDAAADAAAGTRDWFLKTDEDMLAEARWNQNTVPHCTSKQYTYTELIQSPEAVTAGLSIPEGLLPSGTVPDDAVE